MTKHEAQANIGTVADAMLSGAISFIEGAREISRLRFDALLEKDTDICAFVVIDSETDALPLGSVCEHWNPEALAKLQPQIERAETWARQLGNDAAKRLVARFRPEISN